MEQLQHLQTQFGLMTWPLMICSALTVMIIAERLFQVFISLGVGKRAIRQKLTNLDPTNNKDIEALADELSGKRLYSIAVSLCCSLTTLFLNHYVRMPQAFGFKKSVISCTQAFAY